MVVDEVNRNVAMFQQIIFAFRWIYPFLSLKWWDFSLSHFSMLAIILLCRIIGIGYEACPLGVYDCWDIRSDAHDSPSLHD